MTSKERFEPVDGRAPRVRSKTSNRATEESQQVEEQAEATADDPEEKLDPAPTLHSRSSHSSRDLGGEGIGLSIVKRLCELVDASLELETSVGKGTTFRVIFPRQYPE